MAKKTEAKSLKELIQLQQELALQIKEAQETELAEFKARVEKEAGELGLDCRAIWGQVKRSKVGKVSKASKGPLLVTGTTYVNPDDSSEDYVAGKGRRPTWIMNRFEAGETDFS